MKGLKLIQLNEKRRRAGTRLIYFRSHPFAFPSRLPFALTRSSHAGNIAFPLFFRRGLAGRQNRKKHHVTI